MKKLVGMFTLLLLTICTSICVYASNDPVYPNPAGQAVFAVSANVTESNYVTFDWYRVGTPDTKVASHTYNGTGAKWSQEDTYTTDSLSATAQYYCIVHDSISDRAHYVNKTKVARACILNNVGDYNMHSGFDTTITITTDPVNLPDSLVKSKQWYYKEAGSDSYLPVIGETDWIMTTPIKDSMHTGDKYFLRVTLNDKNKNVTIDTKPVTLTVLKAISVDAVQEKDLLDGQAPDGTAVKLTLHYADGTKEVLVPLANQVAYKPRVVEVGAFTYDITYTNPVNDVISTTVKLKATVPEDTPYKDKALESISANYIGSGQKQYTDWLSSDFKVTAKFVGDPETYVVTSFTISPKQVANVSDNKVTISVTHGSRTRTATCNAIGTETNDKNRNGIDDETLVAIKATYSAPKVVKGKEYDQAKLSVIGVADNAGETSISLDQCVVTTKIQNDVYYITVAYGDLTTTVSVPYKSADATSVTATYIGEATVGSQIDKSNLKVVVNYEDDTSVETTAYTIENYALNDGDNTITIDYDNFSTTVVIKAVPLSSLSVNAPTISITKQTNQALANLVIKTLAASGVHISGEDTAAQALNMSLMDNRTSTKQPTLMLYQLNNSGAFTSYSGPVTIAAKPGIMKIDSYSTYQTLQSKHSTKIVYVDANGNTKETKCTGMSAKYKGGDVPEGGTIDGQFIDVEYTFDGTDATLPVTSYEVAKYTIKVGKNLIAVTDGNYTTNMNVTGVSTASGDTNFEKVASALEVTPTSPTQTVGTAFAKGMLNVKVVYNDATKEDTTDYTLVPGTIVQGDNHLVVAYKMLNAECSVYGVNGEVASGNASTPSQNNVVSGNSALKTFVSIFKTNKYASEAVSNNIVSQNAVSQDAVDPAPKPIQIMDEAMLTTLPGLADLSGNTGLRPWFITLLGVLLALALLILLILFVLWKMGKLDALMTKMRIKHSMQIKVFNRDGDNVTAIITKIKAKPIMVTLLGVGTTSEHDINITDKISTTTTNSKYYYTRTITITDLVSLQLIVSDAKGYVVKSDILNLIS